MMLWLLATLSVVTISRVASSRVVYEPVMTGVS